MDDPPDPEPAGMGPVHLQLPRTGGAAWLPAALVAGTAGRRLLFDIQRPGDKGWTGGAVFTRGVSRPGGTLRCWVCDRAAIRCRRYFQPSRALLEFRRPASWPMHYEWTVRCD